MQFTAEVTMDTVGVAIQTVQILVATVSQIRSAIKRQKDQANLLLRVKFDVEETQCVVELVRDNPALQDTCSLYAVLQRVQSLGICLSEHVQAMDKERGAIQAFKHQITQGSAERQDLAAIMDRLGQAKQDLALRIQLVNVGLTMNAQQAIAVNIRLVEDINHVVQKTLGEEQGLLIATFVQERMEGGGLLQADGLLHLTAAEYTTLLIQKTQLEHPELQAAREKATRSPGRKERIVLDNLAVGAEQFNVAITDGTRGSDPWDHMDFVKVQGNVALGGARQVNYPMTVSVFKAVTSS